MIAAIKNTNGSVQKHNKKAPLLFRGFFFIHYKYLYLFKISPVVELIILPLNFLNPSKAFILDNCL